MNSKITLTPLDAYFLGGEQNTGFGGDRTPPYFIRSENVPTQTTLLGLLRYCVLKKHNALTQHFGRGEKQRPGLKEAQERLIGANSFSFDAGNKQSFGHIRKLSPLFLEKDDVLYVRCPLNQPAHQGKAGETYHPFDISSQPGGADGKERWEPGDYSAKAGLYNGWLALDGSNALAADSDIFMPQEQVGIIKSDQGAQESGFFKKEYKRLKEGWSFVFFAELESKQDLASSAVVHMGHGMSAFQMQCQAFPSKWREQLSNLQVSTGYGGTIYYAASDFRPTCEAAALYALCDFASTQMRPFRSLITRREADTYLHTMKKTQRFDLLRSGSVFYVPQKNKAAFESKFQVAAYQAIGFNQLVAFKKRKDESDERDKRDETDETGIL